MQAQGAFAIDLSSRRVRLAAQLLDGVRQGQPLGALLGYRFERSLHERQLDVYIERCRQLAPLRSADAPTPTAASEAIAANRVVDGLLLHQKWQDFVKHQATLFPAPDSPFLVCAAALRELDEAIDALGDAVVAETVYQAVRGNTVRTASTLAAIAHGEAPPPELDVARTPRSGIGLTHRVLWLLAAPAATPAVAGWPAASKSPRAAAEPRLNAWAAGLLPPPATGALRRRTPRRRRPRARPRRTAPGRLGLDTARPDLHGAVGARCADAGARRARAASWRAAS